MEILEIKPNEGIGQIKLGMEMDEEIQRDEMKYLYTLKQFAYI